MSITIDGHLLRNDFTEVITEKFAKKYCINLDNWILPFGYYDQCSEDIIYNNIIPDGSYILLGKVEYPGTKKLTYHTVCQFSGLKISGIDLTFVTPFNPYLDVPKVLKLKPKFPLFKVGSTRDFKKLKKIILNDTDNYPNELVLYDKTCKLSKNTIEYKVYALKLALLRYTNSKEMK